MYTVAHNSPVQGSLSHTPAPIIMPAQALFELAYNTCIYIIYIHVSRLYAESMEIRDIESRGPWAVAFRAQRGRY